MFTGIIEEVGLIGTLKTIGSNQLELMIQCRKIQDDLKIGDSVAVDGVCLTTVKYDNSSIVLELSAETLKNSLFSSKQRGNKVNLERALRLVDRLGGHLVQGHVDCISQIINISKSNRFYEMEFLLPKDQAKYFVAKGSVTINGISLTIANLRENSFQVAVIPHTFEETNLAELKTSDKIHIETDIIARYVERLLAKDRKDGENSNLTAEFLSSHGFV